MHRFADGRNTRTVARNPILRGLLTMHKAAHELCLPLTLLQSGSGDPDSRCKKGGASHFYSALGNHLRSGKARCRLNANRSTQRWNLPPPPQGRWQRLHAASRAMVNPLPLEALSWHCVVQSLRTERFCFRANSHLPPQ